jgi:hypothetical protein
MIRFPIIFLQPGKLTFHVFAWCEEDFATAKGNRNTKALQCTSGLIAFECAGAAPHPVHLRML